MNRLSLRRFGPVAVVTPAASLQSPERGPAAGSGPSAVSHPLAGIDPSPSHEAKPSLLQVNPIIGMTLRMMGEALTGGGPTATFITQLKKLADFQQRGFLFTEDNQVLASHLPQTATYHHVDVHALPGLAPSEQALVDTILLRAEAKGVSAGAPEGPAYALANQYDEVAVSGASSDVVTNYRGGPLLSPKELADKIGLRLAFKTKSVSQDGAGPNAPASRSASYLISDSVPDKAWRVSPAFRSGGYKKVRLAVDNDGKLGIFAVQYIKDATVTRPKSQKPLALEAFQRGERILQYVQSPLGIAEGTEHAFVDQKARIWTWRPFFSTDVSDLSNILRHEQGAQTPFLKLMLGMAEDVARHHEKGLMLLDVKPANFLFDPDRGVTFGDFDFARDHGTMPAGRWCGTPGYASPEMDEGLGSAIGQPTDVFSLAQSYIEMVAGKPLAALAFNYTNRVSAGYRLLETFDADAKADSLLASEYEPGGLPDIYSRLFSLNDSFAELVFERMLHRDPAQRPTAAEVAATLYQALPDSRYQPRYGVPDTARIAAQIIANASLNDLKPLLEALPALPKKHVEEQ